MSEHSDPEQHPGDLGRGHDTARALLIEALSLAMGVLAVFHYQPDGMAAAIIVFVGACAVTHLREDACMIRTETLYYSAFRSYWIT